MTASPMAPSAAISGPKPRARGLPVLIATLYESRSLLAAACG